MILANRLVCTALCLVILPATISAQSSQEYLQNWTRATPGDQFLTDQGVIRASAGTGWARTTRDYVDFVLTVEYRLLTPDAAGAVLTRAWAKNAGLSPQSGYRVAVGTVRAGTDALGTVRGFSGRVTPLMAPVTDMVPASGDSSEWQRLEIKCEGDQVAVSLDGKVISIVEGAEPLAGYIGVECVRGAMEFRKFTLTPLASNVRTCDGSRAVTAAGERPAGMAYPVLRREVKPRYTIEAYEKKAHGLVVLDAVVETDGTVGTVCVVRSDSRDFDAEAVAAARRWEFVPAAVAGKPIRSVVTIELTFKLK